MLKSINSRAVRPWLVAKELPVRFINNSRICIHNSNARRAYSRGPDFVAIDQKWQKKWALQKLISPQRTENLDDNGKKNIYILPMFPYPSGHLHLGHLRVYTIADVLSRFRRMKGHNVLHPMGWDAFGLPAENAAIERGIDPAEWTKQNIANMKTQLQRMNGDWDWDREFATCDPKFYKHTQRIFLMLRRRGLVYQDESLVNYDPVDKTVLANEQVDASGCSWRSGAKVEKRMLKQWFLRISEFRQALLDDLDFLSKDNLWPGKVLSMQRNWIGKSEGARIKFQVSSTHTTTIDEVAEVFTTRPDTLFGVQYLALAPTHPLVVEMAKTNPELQHFCSEIIPTLSQDSKVAYRLDNIHGINPLSHHQSLPENMKETLPIFVAPYVLGDYGSGAVMGVPGHDTRDHTFWKENCADTPIRKVIQPLTDKFMFDFEHVQATSLAVDEPFTSRGFLTSECGLLSGQPSAVAAQNIIAMLNERNDETASVAETWRLRDWLISRQRYWGTPIPIIHCPSCGPRPVPKNQLPVELPPVEGHWLKGKSGNPLEHAQDWINTKCPDCKGDAKRDTDTMDTFVDSSWYFMRFPDSHNETAPFSPESAAKNLPVDLYIGGVEHAILHLLYARFISKFLSTTPLWPKGEHSSIKGEPFKQVITQGMVHGKTYSDPSTGRFLKPDEIDLRHPSNPKIIATGETANVSYEKMSKSKYNGVDPGTCFSKYGADATRAHILFQAPISEVLEWDEGKISGITRWLKRIHDHIRVFNEFAISAKNPEPKEYFTKNLKEAESFDTIGLRKWDAEVDLWLTVQRTIASTTSSLSESYALNTVVSDLMSLTNTILSPTTASCSLELQYHALASLLKMMAPITPAFAEECWEQLHLHSYPQKAQPEITVPESNDSTSTPHPSQHPSSPSQKSVFHQPFPEPDGTTSLLQPRTQTCSVQIKGKFKLAIEIPTKPEGMEREELEKWVVEQIFASGKVEGLGLEKNMANKIIVVKGGKTVNFVTR